jgi:hypothetical protein
MFAALGDVHGSGAPLGFLFVHTTKEAPEHAKEVIIRKFLEGLKARNINPAFTMSDKDQSKINAMTAVWPDAKHQLCYWHALRANKQRLAKNTSRPAKFNPAELLEFFAWESIDFSFVTDAQLPGNAKKVIIY